MKLGVIGDDFTGSSDVALMLADGGMRTVQYVGVPREAADEAVDAGVVALKSRSIAPDEAVAQSLQALRWLQDQGARQFFFKICSTFDSTPEGNIGPVADALIDALDTSEPVVVCPVFPATGRTLYQGHLFVNDRLLSESGMERHPITPMSDADIRRWLARQTKGEVGHVALASVREGGDALRRALSAQSEAGRQLVVVDAIADDDLRVIAEAIGDWPLLVGGSGIALGLPAQHGASGASPVPWEGAAGPAVALCGSCSKASREQVAKHRKDHESRKLEPDAVMDGVDVEALADWALAAGACPLIYSSDDPDVVKAAQDRYGAARLSERLEALFGELARALVSRGVERLIVAGGETSGAVVTALDLRELTIGPKIDPGVPAMRSGGLALALKSGNFGAPDFFAKAARMTGP